MPGTRREGQESVLSRAAKERGVSGRIMVSSVTFCREGKKRYGLKGSAGFHDKETVRQTGKGAV